MPSAKPSGLFATAIALRLFSDGDGVVRVEREDADDDVFRLEQEVLDLKNGVGHGVCFYGTSPDSSLSTGYQPHIGEQDGKVIVNAQYVSWCGTAPDDNYLFELEGLSRVKDGNVRAIIDNYDILITYTDDEGHVRVIAQELKEDGIPMAEAVSLLAKYKIIEQNEDGSFINGGWDAGTTDANLYSTFAALRCLSTYFNGSFVLNANTIYNTVEDEIEETLPSTPTGPNTGDSSESSVYVLFFLLSVMMA